ncbi:hypothetical protein DI53_0661 [Sphingobacterium deserti]|uniref:Uncharacterized protein n=1 Tax=Sphingobacterium deserti TaxID=1229276 RepID=A0A0B8T2K5_9SPHI|nr:hypothetical protein DI53_0661 [Sphingobacterium deserti]
MFLLMNTMYAQFGLLLLCIGQDFHSLEITSKDESDAPDVGLSLKYHNLAFINLYKYG